MTKIADVIELVLPSFKQELEAAMEHAGFDGETSVDKAMDHFKTTDQSSVYLSLGGALSKLSSNKFAPKLNLTKQCEIVALYRRGYNVELLAKAYGIDRKTITHMYNPLSPKYKGVKKMEKELGTDRLIQEYATPAVINRVDAFRPQANGVSNKLANVKQGIHVVQGSNCIFAHRLEIKWCEPPEVEEEGWYHKDMDGDFPTAWIRGDNDSMKNSQAAYNHALKVMEDPL